MRSLTLSGCEDERVACVPQTSVWLLRGGPSLFHYFKKYILFQKGLKLEKLGFSGKNSAA